MVDFLLSTVSIALAIYFLLENWGKWLKQYQCVNSGRFERLKIFPVYIPLLDGLWLLYQFRKRGIHFLPEWARKLSHDTIIQIPMGPYTVLSSNNAALSHKLLSSSHPGHLSRPKVFYHRFLFDLLSKGLLGTEYRVWVHQRKTLSKAFTFKSFQNYIKIMNWHSKKCVSDLRNIPSSKEGHITGPQMHDTIQLNTLRITLEFIMGADFSEDNEAEQFAQNVVGLREIAAYRVLHPESYIPPLWWLHPKRIELQKLIKDVNQFIDKIVKYYQKKTKELENDGHDNLHRCLIEEMLRQNASPEEIHYEIGTFLMAGFETVSTALKFILQHLACHPKYQDLCRDEVDNLGGQYCTSPDEIPDLNIDDLSKLEYMERFINESLRITPPVPLLMRELNSPLKIGDEFILSKGNIVTIFPIIMHHNPTYYPDPEVFDPARFLPEEIAKRPPGTFLPFSGGMRNCIGKRFAMLQMKTTLAWLLRNFEIFSEDGMNDVKLNFEITLRPERDFRISLKKRELHSL